MVSGAPCGKCGGSCCETCGRCEHCSTAYCASPRRRETYRGMSRGDWIELARLEKAAGLTKSSRYDSKLF
jgi:hypothetical protein